MNNSKLWGEIVYDRKEDGASVHSDFHNMMPRDYIHQLLDEWLDKSNGTGVFYIGNLSVFDNE